MKIAIVHDSFIQYGGAERVVEGLHELFPDAPVFTLVWDKEKYPKDISSWNVKISFLQGLYNYHKNFKHFVSLLPFANKAFNFSGFDVVISLSSLFLKGLEVPRGIVHINYCHTPVRFLWTEPEYIDQEVSKGLQWLVKAIIPWLKDYDRKSAQKPSIILANSVEVQKRINQFYGREAEIVYPFVDTEFWKSQSSSASVMPDSDPASRNAQDGFQVAPRKFVTSGMTRARNYFLIGGRLQAHKDLQAIIELFNELNLPLHVVGTGSQENFLKSIAKPNVTFLGRVTDEVLRKEYSGAKGFIFPQFEDFGLMPIEAASCGTATIGLNRGGSLETVLPGVTGELFNGTAEDLRKIILSWNEEKYAVHNLRQHAEKFSKEKFKQSIQAIINSTNKHETNQESGIRVP